MKYPLSRRTTLIIAVILAAVLIISFLASQGQAKEIYLTDTVKRADISKTVDITGSLYPLTHADLSFQSNGNITSVNVKVGDFIRQGQVLATLSAADLAGDARRAQADLDRERAGSREEDISAAYSDVLSAESAARFANNSISLIKALNDSSITMAEDTLEKATDEAAQTAQDDARALFDAENAGLAAVRTGLSKADELLGLENLLFGNEFERELGALNPATVQRAKDFFAFARTDRDLAEAAFLAGDANAVAITRRALEETGSTLLFTRQMLDATSADSVDLSLTDLIAYKAGIDSARSNVESARVSLTRAIDNKTNNALSAVHSVRTAELNLENAQRTAEQENTKAIADATSAQAALQKAHATYNKLIAGPRAVDLAPYEASVDAAWARYAKSTIISPLDGQVGKINLRVGEAAEPGRAVISVSPSKPAFEVIVDVSESDVTHVALGDSATITFDAFGADVEFTGLLTSLDLSEKIIEGVVFYEARVAVTEGPRLAELRSGMSADVTVATDLHTNSLSVPTRAVLEKDGKKIVRVLVNEALVEKEVTIGLRADGGVTEILTGLTEGETIVISIKK
ncbi:MAG: efflux RND transporter periplasmic adaptor subunit [Patescibacteria group bacterium]|jgi:RND family efflux transporter MFP subunit